MTTEGIKYTITGDASGLESATTKASKSLGNLKNSSGSAMIALTNLGRVAQDAPFGFIGISNNLNPLLESFQRLKQETGSSKAALQALGSSLIGGGGLGLALSAVTAAISFVSIGFSSWTRGMQSAKEQADKTAEGISKARDQVADEAVKVQELVAFIHKENLTRAERIAIIKQLQSLAPAYFAQLNAEKASVEDVSRAYAVFNQNLINTVKARVFEEKLKDVIKERIELEQKLSLPAEELVVIDGKAIKARNFYLDLDKQIEQGKKRLITLTQTEADLVKEINILKPPDLRTDMVKPLKEAKEIIDKIRHARIFSLDELQDIQRIHDTINGIKTVKKAAVEPTGPITPSLTLPGSSPEDEERLKRTLGWLKEMKPTLINIDAAIQTVGQAFQGMFDAIFSGSKTAFQAFAQALGQIIKKLIATAVASLVLTAILGPLGLVKSAGGSALKGMDLFKNIFGKLGGFAEGGVSTGPSSGYLAKLHGTEVITPFDDWMKIMNNNSNNRMLIASTEISGNNLRILVKEADKRAGRLF
jgi:hypothetical protein